MSVGVPLFVVVVGNCMLFCITILFAPVVFPNDNTSSKVSEVANLLSTYSFTAALVGSEVLLSKFLFHQ